MYPDTHRHLICIRSWLGHATQASLSWSHCLIVWARDQNRRTIVVSLSSKPRYPIILCNVYVTLLAILLSGQTWFNVAKIRFFSREQTYLFTVKCIKGITKQCKISWDSLSDFRRLIKWMKVDCIFLANTQIFTHSAINSFNLSRDNQITQTDNVNWTVSEWLSKREHKPTCTTPQFECRK